MPYRFTPELSPRQKLAVEARMCFITAAGCLVLGGIGLLMNSLAHMESHLPALISVGAFYAVMGLGRCWKLSRTSDSDIPQRAEVGH